MTAYLFLAILWSGVVEWMELGNSVIYIPGFDIKHLSHSYPLPLQQTNFMLIEFTMLLVILPNFEFTYKVCLFDLVQFPQTYLLILSTFIVVNPEWSLVYKKNVQTKSKQCLMFHLSCSRDTSIIRHVSDVKLSHSD